MDGLATRSGCDVIDTVACKLTTDGATGVSAFCGG
jgi:hypothetical protein